MMTKTIKRIFVIVFTITLFVLGISFRYNFLGFMHEYVQGDVVDLGGYGVEKVQNIIYTEDDESFVLSIAYEHKIIDGFYRDSKYVLISKLDDSNKVQDTFMVLDDSITDCENMEVVTTGFTVIDENKVAVLTTYRDYYDTSWPDYTYLSIIDVSEQTIKNIQLDNQDYKDDYSSSIHFYNDELYIARIIDGATELIELDAATLEILNTTPVGIEPYVDSLEMELLANTIYLVGKTETNTHQLWEFDIETNSSSLVLNVTSDYNHFMYDFTETHFFYSTVEELWHQEEQTFTSFDLVEKETDKTLILDIDYLSNQIVGFAVDENHNIFLQGWIDAPSHVDGAYIKYNSDGEYVETYDTNIGGIDSIKRIEFDNNDDLVLVISSKRIINTFSFNTGNAYDNIIKYKKNN